MGAVSLFVTVSCLIHTAGGWPCAVDKIGIHRFGDNCSLRCHCPNNAACDQDGWCGWKGGGRHCAPGMFGPGCQYVDIAREDPKNARHSSSLGGESHPDRAVDSSIHTCAVTREAESKDGLPWWTLWFPYLATFTYIELDTAPHLAANFSQFRVDVANVTDYSNKDEWPNSTICFETQEGDKPIPRWKSNASPTVFGVFCKQPVVGNAIRIQLLRNHTQLWLCDVRISQGRNMAFNKAVDVSSTQRGNAAHITDGLLGIDTHEDRCYSTREKDPWLSIDFGANVQISQIHIGSYTYKNFDGYQISVKEDDQTWRIIYNDTSESIDPVNITFVAASFNISRKGRGITVCAVKALGDCTIHRCGYDCSKECYCRASSYTLEDKIAGHCPHGCLNSSRWTPSCDQVCPETVWGMGCSRQCGHCAGGTPCDARTGHCPEGCEPGFDNETLCTTCEPGLFGLRCADTCSGHCSDICNHVTGQCACKPGYRALTCTEECAPGLFGLNCSLNCSSKCSDTCDHVTGHCSCVPGFQPPDCNQACERGYWGQNCTKYCTGCNHGHCDPINGTCTSGCKSGYTPTAKCDIVCNPGRFGLQCVDTCSRHCSDICNHVTGHCSCKPGYGAPTCTEECGAGFFGLDCSQNCSSHCRDVCDHVTGHCTCTLGYKQPNCFEEDDSEEMQALLKAFRTLREQINHIKQAVEYNKNMTRIFDGLRAKLIPNNNKQVENQVAANDSITSP